MQTHLYSSTSIKPLIKRMGLHHLELCMIVTDELRRTFCGANMVYRMFSNAQQYIRTREGTAELPSFQREHSQDPITEPEASVSLLTSRDANGLHPRDVSTVMWTPFDRMGLEKYLIWVGSMDLRG